MMRWLFLLGCLLLGLSPAGAIEIRLAKSLWQPELPAGKEDWELGYADIAWIGRDTLIYNRTPHYWALDVTTGRFTRLLEIEQRVGDESSSAHAMARADGAVLDYGPVFHVKHAVFDIQHGWRDIDKKTYKELVVYPIVEDSKELLFDWEYRLLGDYRLVPRPIVQRDNCGVSLREPREGKLRRLPTEFYELLNICSCGELALSFDRFRIAVVGQIVRRKPDSPYELGWLVYLLRVIYEGSVEAPVVLRSSPNASSSEAGRLGAKAQVRVVEAMNYEKEPSGRQDFWYRVEDGKLSGWVFGGELLIEGQGWKERLKLRGEPLDLEALLKDR